jgi:hypothetical protein
MGASMYNIDTLLVVNGVHSNEIYEYIGNTNFDIKKITDYILENNINIKMPKYIQHELDFF